MLYNGQYISKHIPDGAVKCHVGRCSVVSECLISQ
jgi:hypothetical protein